MPINSIETATKFTGELDKLFQQASVTGFMADNNLRAQFVGAKTVKIPSVDFVGLADYDKDTGFSKGAMTVTDEPFTMSMDRARTMSIDAQDMDESGAANLAGQIMGEFVRTKVAPEADAYALSKLAGIAKTRGHYITGSLTTPFANYQSLVSAVQDIVGYDEELVAFIDTNYYNAFVTSTEISKRIAVDEFKKGDISMKVKSIDGVPLFPVVTSRMKSAFTFDAGSTTTAGGFAPAANAIGTYMIVLPKKAAHLVRKTEQIRVFTPEQNQTADAYKFDYRVYYDVFVKKSGIDAVYAAFAPSITIGTDVSSTASATAGSITNSNKLTIAATASDASAVAYQWYKCDDANKSNASPADNGNAATYNLPTTIEAGTHYMFCRVTAGKSTTKDSAVCTITVS